MKPSRMLPEDIANCLKLSDIYGVVKEMGIEAEVVEFLLELMLTDRFWGSLVKEDSEKCPICFGSSIFISDTLADELENGKHPFLLAEFCQNQQLRNHILTYDQVKMKSKDKQLNFYGALFSFARVNPVASPLRFVKAMNQLHQGLITSMAGFGLGRYYKQTYEGHLLARLIKSSAMRKKFGADLITEYPYLSPEEVGTHFPTLFGCRRENPVDKLGFLVCDLLYPAEPELALPESLRMILRLEIDGLSPDQIRKALGKGHGTEDSNWATGLEKLNRSVKNEINSKIGDNRWNRERVRVIVRANPQELGVLPQLAEGEKAMWRRDGKTRQE